jgi:hypothetical protein
MDESTIGKKSNKSNRRNKMNPNPLKVIGAGFGRTGTESLKQALEQLGFGKCYHMFELMKNPEHLAEWETLERGETPNYDLLFRDYQSCTDFPAALYYREFMQQYPNSKVVLTVRDADKWYESATNTILREIPSFFLALIRFFGLFSKTAQAYPAIHHYAVRIIHRGIFEGRVHDREHTKAIFNAWNEEVTRTVPAERLLVFQVKDGWEPLCHFLGVSVPSTPFPRSNDGASFDQNLVKRIMSNPS